MFLLISEDLSSSAELTERLSARGIYLFRAPAETARFLCDAKDVGGVLIDGRNEGLNDAEWLCRDLRKEYPEIPVAVIVSRAAHPDLPADGILREAEDGTIPWETFMDFCRVCGWRRPSIRSYYLTLGDDPASAAYMGYPLCLSEREYEVLRCLFYRAPLVTTADDLMSLCYPCGRQSIANLSVVIGKINRRAAAIDGRKLIENCYGKGYRLRDGILEPETTTYTDLFH